MKKLMNLGLVAFLLLCIATSCTRNDATAPKPVKEQETLITQQQIANLANPFDEKGKMHNAFLDYFIHQVNPDKGVTQDEIMRVVERFYKEHDMAYTAKQQQGFQEYLALLQRPSSPSPWNPFRPDWNICKLLHLPEWLCKVINHDPFGPISLSKSDGETAKGKTLAFIKHVEDIEAKVINSDSTEIGDKARKVVLTYYAVARYSSAYWYNLQYVQKDENPWYKPYMEKAAMRDCPSCEVIQTDAAGAVAGALFGGVGAPVGAGIASAIAAVDIWLW